MLRRNGENLSNSVRVRTLFMEMMKNNIDNMDSSNRMELQSADGVQLNLDALYQIAPSCFTEVADKNRGH